MSKHYLTNRSVVQQFGVKCYIRNIVAGKMSDIKLTFFTVSASCSS